MLALVKIFFAYSGIMSKILLRVNPDFLLSSLSCPNATADSASNFVNTTTTGTEGNAIISYRIEDVVLRRTVVGVTLGEKLFLSHRDGSVVLIHWDAIPVTEKINIKQSRM